MCHFIAKLFGNAIVSHHDKKPHKKNFILDIIENPENFILTAFIENDKLSIEIKRKETKNGIP